VKGLKIAALLVTGFVASAWLLALALEKQRFCDRCDEECGSARYSAPIVRGKSVCLCEIVPGMWFSVDVAPE
jgi:hypothetical protein